MDQRKADEAARLLPRRVADAIAMLQQIPTETGTPAPASPTSDRPTIPSQWGGARQLNSRSAARAPVALAAPAITAAYPAPGDDLGPSLPQPVRGMTHPSPRYAAGGADPRAIHRDGSGQAGLALIRPEWATIAGVLTCFASFGLTLGLVDSVRAVLLVWGILPVLNVVWLRCTWRSLPLAVREEIAQKPSLHVLIHNVKVPDPRWVLRASSGLRYVVRRTSKAPDMSGYINAVVNAAWITSAAMVASFVLLRDVRATFFLGFFSGTLHVTYMMAVDNVMKRLRRA
jgi:hypothetical protein